MLFEKKKRISEYLSKKNSQSVTPFDILLSEYLCGTLKQKLSKFDFQAISIQIDWLPDYKCISIQAKFHDYFFDIQIEATSFSVSYDKDEPDDAIEFELIDETVLYSTIEDIICKLA